MNRLAALTLLAAGCWDGERSSLPRNAVPFAPAGVDMEGWTVREATVDLACPDGRDARIYFVHPTAPNGPLPAVLLFHSGSFDFVEEPPPEDPLGGEPWQEVPRLGAPWAIHMVYATLGMYPPPLDEAEHTGALVAAFAEQDVALVLPTGCWGDLWHNRPAVRENDILADRFFRAGATVASWAWRLLDDPAFGPYIGMDGLPFEPRRGQLALVGLGEGGRAVAELLHDGAEPAAVVIEGHNDDLHAWSAARPGAAEGLRRIFQDRPYGERAYSALDAPPPTMWIYSSLDPLLASGSQDAALALLGAGPHEVVDREDTAHLVANADPDLAADVVDFVLGRW